MCVCGGRGPETFLTDLPRETIGPEGSNRSEQICDNVMYHIFGAVFVTVTQSLHKLFPANWVSACHDDNRKLCILNGERLSCPAQIDKVRHYLRIESSLGCILRLVQHTK